MPLSRFIIISAIVLLVLLWPFHVNYQVNYSTGARRSVTYFAGLRLYARGMEPNAFEKIPVDSVALGLPAPKSNWRTYSSRFFYSPLLPYPSISYSNRFIPGAMAIIGELSESISPEEAMGAKSMFLHVLNQQGGTQAGAFAEKWGDDTRIRLGDEGLTSSIFGQ